LGSGDVGHTATEAEPGGDTEGEGAVGGEGPEVERDGPGFSEAAELGDAGMDGGGVVLVDFPEGLGDIESVVPFRVEERAEWFESDEFVRGEGF
jgi:hypothetical protein